MRRGLGMALILALSLLLCTATAEGGTATVANCESYVTLREKASTSSSEVARVPLGARVETGTTAGSFTLCRYQNREGYILTRYLCSGEDTASWTAATVANCESYVTLRNAPSRSAAEVARVPLGARVEAGADSGEYTRCVYGEQEGYILTRYLRLAADAPQAAGTGVLTPNVRQFLTLRDRPDSAAAALAELSPGTRMEVLGWTGAFAKVRVAQTSDVGYVHSGYVQDAEAPSGRWPYDYDALLEDAAALEACGVVCETIGRSADGRDILVLRCGSGEKHILIQAGLHGRELMTGRLVMDLLKDWVQRGGAEDVTLHVLPMMNPDGVTVAVHGPSALNDGALAARVSAMLDREGAECGEWKSNARGVDLNRNFPYGWQTLKDAQAGSRECRGASPLSEPETAALANYAGRYDFAATVSYHSFGSLIYCAGGADEAANRRARSLAQTLGGAVGYLAVNEGSGMEKGGFKDWMLGERGVPSVTVEVGANGSMGSASECTALYLRHRGSWEALAQWVQ